MSASPVGKWFVRVEGLGADGRRWVGKTDCPDRATAEAVRAAAKAEWPDASVSVRVWR